MKQVKVMPKFKCDFCSRRSTKAAMTAHERICFRNPNRFCDHCENKGFTVEREDIYSYEAPCIYCSKFDPKIKDEIEAREGQLLVADKTEEITEVPF